MTKRETLEMMRADAVVMAKAEYKKFVEHELEILDNKALSKASSPKAKENEQLKERIIDLLKSVDEPMRAKHIAERLSNQYETVYSTNKVSSMLTQLKNDKRVIRTQIKKDVFFSTSEIATEE